MLCIDPSFACIRIINTRFVDTKCKNILILLSGGNIHLINTNIFGRLQIKSPAKLQMLVYDEWYWQCSLRLYYQLFWLVGSFIPHPSPLTSSARIQCFSCYYVLFLTQNKYTQM